MCGICGIAFPGRSAAELRERVEAMSLAIAHRGPDGSGILAQDGLALGHRRLSIIDLEGGAQPMEDPRGFAITYNGEVYNYRAVRAELLAAGDEFRTRSDTEVVLRASIRWEEDCLRRLDGMFAFAVADLGSGDLLLARDRLGVKPLYYAVIEGGLVFGSEIKALLASGLVPSEPDLSLVPFYLATGYFPREFTAFRGIRQLRPGHFLRFGRMGAQTYCFWDAGRILREERRRRATREDEAELMELIGDAVRAHTVADVPVGTFLSGGLDSGIVTASLARSGPPGFQTFNISFPSEPSADESRPAREVARRYSTVHRELPVGAEDLAREWEGLLDRFDQPFADLSAVPTYLLSRFARQHVKVALSGDGGDEQWGGYGNYRRYVQLRRLRRLLGGNGVRRAAAGTTRVAARAVSAARPALAERLDHYAGLLTADDRVLYAGLDRQASDGLLESLAGDRLRAEWDPELSLSLMKRDPADHLDGVMLNDLQVFMVDDVLRKVDAMSMAVGLEVRVPLLDHRLVEKSLRLSWKDKVTGSTTKALVRRLFAPHLPRSVVVGRKRGFGLPADAWLRGPLRDRIRETLLGRAARERGVLEPRAVEAVVEEFLAGRGRRRKLVVSLVALERWLARHDS